jgi:hypothetical protein
MKEAPKKKMHYGKNVWTNPTSEGIRREECLCLNCSKMNSCEDSKALFLICKQRGLSLIVTRCLLWKSK